MKIIWILILTLLSNSGYSNECAKGKSGWRFKKKSEKLEWTAYKFTSKYKASVPGGFHQIDFTHKPSASQEELFRTVKFEVIASTLFTNNTARDPMVIKRGNDFLPSSPVIPTINSSSPEIITSKRF